MKKIITLIAAALAGLAVSAQDCPTESMLYLLNGDDAANVEIELGLSKQNSATLIGFNFEITKPDGAEWKTVDGEDYFTAHGYAPYIMGCFNENSGFNLTDEQLEQYLYQCCDVLNSLKNDKLRIIETLYSIYCRFYPAYPGKVGKFAIDMSALEDGEYELFADNTPEGGTMIYKQGPNGQDVWQINEPMVLTLMKQGNTVIEKSSIRATFVSQLSGISTIMTDKADNRIFDLQGRELKSVPEHGVYIQNGKKHVK